MVSTLCAQEETGSQARPVPRLRNLQPGVALSGRNTAAKAAASVI